MDSFNSKLYNRRMQTASYDSPLKECLLCDSGNIQKLFTDCRHNEIYTCGGCGLQFMNPLYSDKHLEDYYSRYTEVDEDNLKKWEEPLLYGHDYYLQLVERFEKPGQMFDVGSGSGALMQAAIKRGWQVQGYDVDPKSTALLAQRLNTTVYSGDFITAPIPEGQFDLVTMHQVLEHVKNPKDYLEKIARLIKPGGTFFIAVPNIDSLSNRVKFKLEALGIRRKRRGVYYASDHHLTYFTPDVLETALKTYGFKTVYVRNCHAVRPGQSPFKRWFSRNFSDYWFYKSAFLIIAKKI